MIYKTVTFCLLGANNKPAYNAASCKEYILDCTLETIHPKHSSGLYSGLYKPIYLDQVYLLVGGADANKSLDLLRLFESHLDIPATQVSKHGNSLLFKGHQRWHMAPPMLSLYALLIRSGRNHELGLNLNSTLEKFYNNKANDYTTLDYSMIQIAKKGIEYILTYGDQTIFGEDIKKNWLPGLDVHSRGIINFSQGELKRNHKHWYKYYDQS